MDATNSPLRRHFVRDPTRNPLGRVRFPASVTQLASSQLSINKRHRRSSDPPATRSFRCRVALQFASPPPLGVVEVPGGGERDRTDDLLLAKQALSQLSYTPVPEDRDQGSGISHQNCQSPALRTKPPPPMPSVLIPDP